MAIKFKVRLQTLTAPYPPVVVSRSQDYLRAEFSFSDDWYGVQKIAQFVRGELKYNILLDSLNACFVPWELLESAGEFSVTVWGNNEPGNDNIVITTNKISITVCADGLDDELLPLDPTVGVEGGLLTQCQEYAESAAESEALAEKWATYTDGTVDDSEYSAKKYAQNAGDSAADADADAVAAAASAVLAQNWANKTDGTVDGSEYSAKKYAIDADNSADSAADSAGDALGYRNTALQYKNDAYNSAGNAANSESNALGYKNAAADSATSAEKWASYTGGTVDGTSYSAKQYAANAAASASAAAASAAVLANTPHFEFDANGYLNLVYTS